MIVCMIANVTPITKIVL